MHLHAQPTLGQGLLPSCRCFKRYREACRQRRKRRVHSIRACRSPSWRDYPWREDSSIGNLQHSLTHLISPHCNHALARGFALVGQLARCLLPLCFVFLPGRAIAAPQQAPSPLPSAVMHARAQHGTSIQQQAAISVQGQLTCQSALASICTANFASILSHVHASHVAKMLTYQAQRVRTL